MRLLARTDKFMHKSCGFFLLKRQNESFSRVVAQGIQKTDSSPQNRCLSFFKLCEFFVTAKFIKCKQYVNDFLLRVILLVINKKISYSKRV